MCEIQCSCELSNKHSRPDLVRITLSLCHADKFLESLRHETKKKREGDVRNEKTL